MIHTWGSYILDENCIAQTSDRKHPCSYFKLRLLWHNQLNSVHCTSHQDTNRKWWGTSWLLLSFSQLGSLDFNFKFSAGRKPARLVEWRSEMMGVRIPSQNYSQSSIIHFASTGTVCSSTGDVLSPRASDWQLFHSVTAKCEIITYFHLLSYYHRLIRTAQRVGWEEK